MADTRGYEYVSDDPVPPGDTIAEMLEERGLTQADFALLLGRSAKNVNQVVNGIAPVTHELAIDLERVLDVPAAFWNAAEARYRDLLARRAQLENTEALVSWSKRFPVKTMTERGWIAREQSPAEAASDMLRYFGAASPEAWEDYWGSPRRLAARMSSAYTTDVPALTVWLRQGEIAAQAIETQPYDPGRFRDALARIRSIPLTQPAVWQDTVVKECASAGVTVVFVRELNKIRCHAVSRWLTPDKPMIELCLRYRTDDQLVFSLFHEAGHILKHGKKTLHISDLNADSQEEAEADEFAAGLLVPAAEYRAFVSRGFFTPASVRAFARSIDVAPGIVVGRLQHDGHIRQSYLNELKLRLEWATG